MSRREWRQPAPEQLQCEKDLEAYLTKMLKNAQIRGKTLDFSHIDQGKAARDILPYLEQAEALGKQYATHYIERGLGKWVGGLLDRAANLIMRNISWAGDLFTSQVDDLGSDAPASEIEQVLEGIASNVAENLAITEIQTVIEQVVMSEMVSAGVAMKQAINSPDACPVCVTNADQGPIPIDQPFASGDDTAPFHGRCRCSVTSA